MKASFLLVLVSAAGPASSFGLDSLSYRSFTSTRSSVRWYPQVRKTVETTAILSSRNSRALCASTEENDEESDLWREELTRKYNTCSILFGLVSLILVAMPDRTNTVQLASKMGGAAGYGLAAGTSHILAGATSHDRLGSDTYKRLNVGLLGSSLLSLVAIPGEAAFHPSFGVAVLLLGFMGFVKGFGAIVFYKGWRRGIDPESDALAPTEMIGEFVSGVKSTLGGIYNTPRKGFVYLMYFLLVLAGGFSALMQGMFNMGYTTSLFPISLQTSAFARLFLVSTMIYSLKDAAERDRLTGTTFIQLNFLVGLWALAVGIGQGTSRLGFSFSRTPMLLCSVPFLYEGIRSLSKKPKKASPSE